MTYELKPLTPAGEKFVAAADRMVPILRERAGDADRANTINEANFNDLLEAGITAAFVPESLGGFGLTSIHDWMAGIARLARGDGSVAICMNMHLAVCRNLANSYEGALASGKDAVVQALEGQCLATSRPTA